MLTTAQFQTLDDLYAFYNVRLFGAALPDCIVNLSRHANSYGFFAPYLWTPVDPQTTDEFIHEISLNPDFLLRKSIQWHTTLVHEMVHLWQYEFGHPARIAYHSRQWAAKIKSIGLMPSHTGQPGGKQTGQTMSQYIIPGGAFEQSFNSLDPEELELLRLKYHPVTSLAAAQSYLKIKPDGADGGDSSGSSGSSGKSRSGRRQKYTCPCGNNVWGKSGLLIHCLECDDNYTILE